MTTEAGLRIAGYASYYRAGRSESQQPPFACVLETALALGAPLIRVWAGTSGSVEVTSEAKAGVVADLGRIAALAGSQGIRVATEFHSGTLTDSAESTAALMTAVGHPNLATHWQAPHGESVELASASLRTVLPWLAHLHVFHWWPGPANRRPLMEGESRWREYLAIANGDGAERFALLEFIPDDAPVLLRREAHTLRSWLEESAIKGPRGLSK
jgi:3-dehydroshikimate dehydratase